MWMDAFRKEDEISESGIYGPFKGYRESDYFVERKHRDKSTDTKIYFNMFIGLNGVLTTFYLNFITD